jgi:DNA-binding winged helix-turn-helix (wHTH) protein
VEFRILGPLEVARDGEPLALGAVQQRALLAVLVLRCGEAVSTGRLVDELWGERAPATAAKTVQVYVSHLRKVLGAGVIVTQGRGYRLAAAPGGAGGRESGPQAGHVADRDQYGVFTGSATLVCHSACRCGNRPCLAP